MLQFSVSLYVGHTIFRQHNLISKMCFANQFLDCWEIERLLSYSGSSEEVLIQSNLVYRTGIWVHVCCTGILSTLLLLCHMIQDPMFQCCYCRSMESTDPLLLWDFHRTHWGTHHTDHLINENSQTVVLNKNVLISFFKSHFIM